MYYYIVDPQKLNQPQFERVQNLLYSSLSEYRISGEVVRVTGLRTIGQLVETAFSRGTKTLVAVGTEDTLHDVINAIKGRDVVVGFIPLVESEIGEVLGIKNIELGAKIIGQRRIAELNLGLVNRPPRAEDRRQIEPNGDAPLVGERRQDERRLILQADNGNYFVSKLSFGLGPRLTGSGILSIFNFKLIQSLLNLPTFEIKFAVDNEYQATLKVVGGIIASNLTEGVADLLLLPKLSRWETIKYQREILAGEYEKIPGSSQVHVKKIEILNPVGLPLRTGSRIIAKTPAIIEIIPNALKIIVGKDRKF